MVDTGRTFALCADLLASTARDLETWEAREDVNWPAAGQAALVSLEAVMSHLKAIRDELVPALLVDDARHRARVVVDPPDRLPANWVPGNAGPGYP